MDTYNIDFDFFPTFNLTFFEDWKISITQNDKLNEIATLIFYTFLVIEGILLVCALLLLLGNTMFETLLAIFNTIFPSQIIPYSEDSSIRSNTCCGYTLGGRRCRKTVSPSKNYCRYHEIE